MSNNPNNGERVDIGDIEFGKTYWVKITKALSSFNYVGPAKVERGWSTNTRIFELVFPIPVDTSPFGDKSNYVSIYFYNIDIFEL